MSTSDDQAHLLDVVRAAQLIVQFVEETSAEGFRTNLLVQSAMLH